MMVISHTVCGIAAGGGVKSVCMMDIQHGLSETATEDAIEGSVY